MNTAGNDNLDLATVNGMMNLCEAKEQAKLNEAAAITEPQQRREAYARRLREFYAKQGVAMTEETIQKSVAEYLETKWRFRSRAAAWPVFSPRSSSIACGCRCC